MSALSTGAGAILVILAVQRVVRSSKQEHDQVRASERWLSRVDVPLVVVELVVLFFFLFIMSGGPSLAGESARYLVSGGFALAFWVGVVGIGLLVPLGLEVWSLRSGQGLTVGAVAGLCLLVGGVVLRYAVLSAGANVSTALGLR